LRRDPGDETAWDQVDEAARESDNPESAATLYRQALERDLSPALANVVGRRAVAFHDEWFEDTELLAGLLARVLTLDPSAAWAFERLTLLLTMGERWDALLREYDRALAAASDPARRATLLDEAARVAKDFAGDVARANDYLMQLLLLRPTDESLASSLERRLEQQERHLDLIAMWRARLPALDAQQALETRVRIAQRFLDPLGQVSTALENSEALLELAGGEPLALALLERIAVLPKAEISLRQRALRLLKEHYAKAIRASDVIRVLGLALEVAPDDEESASLHRETADWMLRNGQLPAALEHTAAALCLRPADSELREQLASLADETGLVEQRAKALVNAAAAARDPALAASLLLEAALKQV
jgi:hypothetical protein